MTPRSREGLLLWALGCPKFKVWRIYLGVVIGRVAEQVTDTVNDQTRLINWRVFQPMGWRNCFDGSNMQTQSVKRCRKFPGKAEGNSDHKSGASVQGLFVMIALTLTEWRGNSYSHMANQMCHICYREGHWGNVRRIMLISGSYVGDNNSRYASMAGNPPRHYRGPLSQVVWLFDYAVVANWEQIHFFRRLKIAECGSESTRSGGWCAMIDEKKNIDI